MAGEPKGAGGGGAVLLLAGARGGQQRADHGRAGGVYIVGGVIPRLPTCSSSSGFAGELCRQGLHERLLQGHAGVAGDRSRIPG
ncbi:glucokinase [Pseudomonas peli]|uniref:glucokinase n=1 Tax=Pseudomonas peli TaxID=592361 RepID=UPI0031F6F2E4